MPSLAAEAVNFPAKGGILRHHVPEVVKVPEVVLGSLTGIGFCDDTSDCEKGEDVLGTGYFRHHTHTLSKETVHVIQG